MTEKERRRWYKRQAAVLLALGDDLADVEAVLAKTLAWLPPGADPKEFVPDQTQLERANPVGEKAIADARTTWYAADWVPARMKRLLDARPELAELFLEEWREEDHPREPAGSPEGGQFSSVGAVSAAGLQITAIRDHSTKEERPWKPSDFKRFKSELAQAMGKGALVRMRQGCSGFVVHDSKGNLVGALSYKQELFTYIDPRYDPEKPKPGEWPEGRRLEAEYLASTGDVKGTGTFIMAEACRQAAEYKVGLFLYSNPGSEGFYRHIGMTELEKNEGEMRRFIFSAKQARAFHEAYQASLAEAAERTWDFDALAQSEPADGLVAGNKPVSDEELDSLSEEWREEDHPREPAGGPGGGRFTSGSESPDPRTITWLDDLLRSLGNEPGTGGSAAGAEPAAKAASGSRPSVTLPTPPADLVERVRDYALTNAAGFSPEEREATLAAYRAVWRAELDENPIVCFRSLRSVWGLLEGEPLLNCFQANAKTGGYWDTRRDAEEKMGLPQDTPPEERPIYACVGTERGRQAGKAYGGVELTFNEDVKDRSTVCDGDSFGNVLFEREIVQPYHTADELSALSYDGFRVDPDGHDYTAKRQTGTDYAEVQVYGGITLKDVASVRIKHDLLYYAPLDEIDSMVERLRERGIKVTEENRRK